MYENKRVCVVIPALNEEQSIGKVIRNVPAFVDLIIVVNDGSSDGTVRVAEECGAHVINHSLNQGLGVAFRTGIGAALSSGADIIVNIDADGQFDPVDIEQLVRPIAKNETEMVTASRFMDRRLRPNMPRMKLIGNRLMSLLVSSIVGRKLNDVSCGFRAYSRRAACSLNSFGRFTYTQETLIELAFKGVSIMEVPVLVKGAREFGCSRISSNLFLYGANTSRILLEVLRDYRAFRVFGIAGLVIGGLGVLLSVLFFWHLMRTGSPSPHKWAAFVGAFLIITGGASIVLGFVADMLSRIRIILEEILARMRNFK